MVNSFLCIDKSMIALKLSGGPFVLPSFCSGVRIPATSSSG